MTQETRTHEPHDSSGAKLNWLRAAVLGANDGIISIAGLVVGVAGATTSKSVIVTAGMAGLIAGAISMAAGEYVSVSSQRDSERALLAKELNEIENFPEQELRELEGIYVSKGLSAKTARQVAIELTARDAYAAHIDVELGLDPNDLTNPMHAAIASAASFLAGAVIPMIAVVFFPAPIRTWATFASVLVALALTGTLSAHVGGASQARATLRVVIGGALAMGVTYMIGKAFHVSA